VHINVETLAALVTVVLAAASGLSALFGHWLARRQASGRVATSEAAQVWDQSQDMRHMLENRVNRAEDQRDRLIEAYTAQVLPMLTSINQLVRDLSGAVADGLGMIRELQAELREGCADEPLQEPARRPQG
jgi:chromosome condensin MukBEF ATPase and DNA-binding subunit MukB